MAISQIESFKLHLNRMQQAQTKLGVGSLSELVREARGESAPEPVALRDWRAFIRRQDLIDAIINQPREAMLRAASGIIIPRPV